MELGHTGFVPASRVLAAFEKLGSANHLFLSSPLTHNVTQLYTMVRLKHRYLLINILYPSKPKSSTNKPAEAIHEAVQFHAPTPDQFNAQLLNRMIRDGIEDLFGDYGISMVASSLKGEPTSSQTSAIPQLTLFKQ
jgi:hypothetical protein